MTQYALLGTGVIAGSVLSAIITWPVRQILLNKSTVQPISENAPEKHRLKHGTPTMGGIGILIAIIIVGTAMITMLPSKSDGKAIGLLLLTMFLGGVIGAIDDIGKVTGANNKAGLSERVKLILQLSVAGLFVVGCRQLGFPVQSLWPGLPSVVVDIIAIVFITGFCNAVNFTDGLDSLLTGVSSVVSLTLGVLLMMSPTVPLMMGVYGAVAGATLGFLLWNAYPARIFMGDTGSLALGMFFPAAALLTGQVWALALCGAVFLLEISSMMLQRYVFKYRRLRFGIENARANRVFRRAPLHHHFE
ncbi:MAG: phospho-N-acetylmuramoyl-pentapeptide-transferase, partial [Armatimonadota bacterium]